ncbi:hypothetical protein E2C01_038815 [Portunus trituberculatus]|uniref:Uncharacterized protein n=1 Tax=Portunus trituberculatus TaxID=210409 RepID=A0A5B7FIZ6_PORTR|nr:hypothetical protein [Portunus trituberculatus]
MITVQQTSCHEYRPAASSVGAARRGARQDKDGSAEGDLEHQVTRHHVLHRLHWNLQLCKQPEPQQLAVGEQYGHQLGQQEMAQQQP